MRLTSGNIARVNTDTVAAAAAADDDDGDDDVDDVDGDTF